MSADQNVKVHDAVEVAATSLTEPSSTAQADFSPTELVAANADSTKSSNFVSERIEDVPVVSSTASEAAGVEKIEPIHNKRKSVSATTAAVTNESETISTRQRRSAAGRHGNLKANFLLYSAAKFTIFHVNSREFTHFHTFSRNLFFTGMDGKQS
jgi:hypothetical protein